MSAANKNNYYQHHIFFCVNQREGGRQCCADSAAAKMRAYAKDKIKELNLHGKGGVRINQSGCLDRCTEGPLLVIYPQGIWYRYKTQNDIDEIINQHIIAGEIVARLQI